MPFEPDPSPVGGHFVPDSPSGVANGTGAREDLLKSLERGLLKLPGQTAGLLDIPAALTSGDRPITRAAEWIGKATGFQPGKWADEMAFSPGYVAAQQDIAPAWNPVEQALADPSVSKSDFARTVIEHLPEIAGKYAEHPMYSLNQAVESVPGMIAGGGLSRVLMTAGRAPGVVGGLERLAGSWAAPIAGGVGEGAMQAGQVMDEYKGSDQQRAAVAALASGGLDALIAGAGGRIANRLGLETPETLMAKIGDKSLAGATAKGTATAAAKLAGGAIGEGALQELPQSMQEQAWQNWADGKPIGEGVLRAGVEGGITGGLIGAGANVPGAARALIPQRAAEQPATIPPVAGSPPAIPAAEVLDEPKPSAAEEALAPRKLTDLDRVAEIDRALAAMPVQETGATPERAALEQERADLSRSWPATVKGQPTTFSTEAGARVDGQYALIEADALQASHDTDLRPNPAYPADLQPRDRTRAASEAQIASIVGRLDPARLGQSATAADGAPIIGADGLVESGNARTIALQRVYRANGQKAENYKAWLHEASAAVGLSPEQVDAMRQPVLVRVRTTPVNRAEFARQANASTVAAMSPLEQARSDATRIDALDDLRPDENGDFATSRDFIRRFVGRLPSTEQAGMIDAGGQLSASGYARVRNAVLAKAYGDSPVLTRMVESMDDSLRNVSRALLIAAPRVAQARAAIQAGRRFDADITPHLVGAVEELGRIKDAGGSVADALAQSGLMGDERTPEARDLLAFLAENTRRPRRMADFITTYFDALDAAGDPAQGSLMGEVQAPTTGQLMAAARREQGGNDGSPSQDAGRGHAGEVAPAVPSASGRSPDAQGGSGGTKGNAAPAANAGQVAEEWRVFAPETGTLGVPRAEMPQVKVARRPELFEFLQGRGIGHQRVSLPADSLKPTQAEYSPAKTESAAHLVEEQSDRAAVLVSSDGYVLDGHHRWLARFEAHQPVWAIQFDAPIGRLLDAVMQFPGAHVSKDSEGAVVPSARDLAVADLKDAVGELGDFLTRHMRAAIVEEDKPRVMPIMVKVADAAIRIVGTDLRRVVAWMRDHFRRNKGTLPGWNTIPATWYREAAEKALAGLQERGQQTGLFDEAEQAQADLFAAAPVEPDAPVPAAPTMAASESGKGGPTTPRRMHIAEFKEDEQLPAEAIAQAKAEVQRLNGTIPAPQQITAQERQQAEALIAPMVEIATAEKPAFDAKVEEVAKASGSLGWLLAPLKSLERSASKLVLEAAMQPSKMRDLLRATIVVSSFADAQRAVDAIYRTFEVVPGRIKNRTPAELTAPDLTGQSGLLQSGYGDVLVNVKAGGIEAEILINVPEMLAAKEGQGHKLYEIERGQPAGSDSARQVVDAQRAFYAAASAAANLRQSASDSRMASDMGGQPREGLSSPPTKSNGPSEGISTDSKPESRSKNSQPSGNLPGTFIAPPSAPIVPEAGENPYTADKGKSSDDAAHSNDREGDAGSRTGPARAVEGAGQADGVPAGDGGRGQQPGSKRVGADAGSGEPAVPPEGRNDERAGRGGKGKRARRGAAVPAGRDLKPKSGLNYRFTDDDISPPGSWAKRAAANVEAVELVKKLDAEKRQATPEEQRVLARFVGWGASDLAQNLFSSKLDKLDDVLQQYEEAVKAFEKRGNWPMVPDRYNSYVEGRYAAFSVLNYAAGGKLDYYRTTEITREQLDKAAPKKSDRAWLELRNRLRAVMTEGDLAEASRSTQYGHYTSAGVVRGMWRALERFGFKGGLVLEPGAGKGNFPGLMPDALAANSSYTGIEYDSITGAILRQLFPDENTRTESYIDTKLPRDFYDVGIGNPPFAGLSVLADPEYKRNAFKLHDYFFAKTIDRVRPGGMVVFVTSRFTMDKQGDKARAYLAERADLLGAIRLPQTAFKENAGTEVVTDVLFLRKKVPGEVFEHGQAWLKSVPVDVAGKPEQINEYFAAHPEMILGTPSRAGSMYRKDEYTVEAPAGEIADLFNAAVDLLPADVMTPARGSAGEAAVVRDLDFNPKAKKEGNYYVNDKGILMQREGGVGVAVQLPKADEAIVRSFVPLRDALKQAQHDQLNDGDWQASLAALQAAYKAFTDAHGRINQFKLRNVNVKVDVLDDDGVPTGAKVAAVEERPVYPIATALQDDPEFTLVRALEDVNEDTGEIKPSDFLNQRVLGAPRKVEAATPHDAMLAVLNDTGKVDIGEIAERLDMDEADVIAALGSAVYRNPQGGAWETADEYLSGDVVKKLALAEAAAKNDPAYERNLEPLRAARPPAKSPANIDIAIGMNWIPGSVYEQFLRETAGVKSRVIWNDATRQWAVSFTDTKGVRSHQRPAAVEEWGTAHRHAGELLEHALTGRPVMIRNDVRTPEGGTKSVANPAAIEAANEKLEKLKAEFGKWIWRDTERSDFIVRMYNDQFNTIAPRSFDGRHLTLPGTSALFNVFDHVKRGAWRVIQSGNTYLAHAVGSGKTFEMVISAMEQKRLGLIKKPMMVVPNHMLRQFASEWMQLYPAARLMVADENAFHKDKRRQFVSRVALSDLDGVIITHSAFKLLDMDPAYRAKIVEEQLDQLRAALEQVEDEDDSGRSPRVKQIEKRIETLEQKLVAAQKSASKDQNARFDELGVDMLYVDEAHLYRKLDFGTSRQVKGISSDGSDAALDLYVKTRWLEDKHPGRSLVMASGTPITNTLAELYSVQRYLGRQALIDKGIEDFDSWAAMFGREKTALEANASGKYEPVTRFSEFVNVPGLIQMFKQFADVLTADNLAALLGDKRPKVQGGARKIIVTPKTTRYRHYQRTLAARVETSRKWKPTKDEPNNPDPMIRIIGDGRLAAIDMRFVSPHAPSDPNSKLNKMIDDVIAAYRETADMEYTDKRTGKPEPNKGATMMVFSDLGFGEGVAANRGFNARAWFEKRLRDAGVPATHVAFMGDYKKASDKLRLFQDMNAGRKRILVGSSKNMGTGVNAQQRLLDLFHLDSPWFPADLEQREGRIVRQGNKNKEVRLRAYVAKGSYDSTMWDMLARKGFFIDQALQGDPNIDRIEDLDSVSQYALASAMAAGDPRVLQLAGMRADIEKGNRLWQAHEDQRQRFKRRYEWAEHTAAASRALLADADAAAAKVTDLSGDKFVAVVDGKTYTERKAFGQALKDAARYAASGVEKSQVIGDVSGFPVRFASRRTESEFYWNVLLQTPQPVVLMSNGDEDPVQMAIKATNTVANVVRLPATLRDAIQAAEAERDALRTRLETPFPMADMLAAKQREAAALEAEIASASKDRPWRVERTDTGMFLTVMAHNEETAVDKGMEQLGGEPEAWRAIEFDQVREYDEEESTTAAAMGMIPPTYFSRGTAGGIDLRTLQAVKDRLTTAMPGMPSVEVLASPADAPQALRTFIEKRGAMADAEGAFHGGRIYLFASGIEDEARAEHVLAEHEVAHAGLAALLGSGKQQAMQALFNNNADIRQAAKPLIDGGMPLAEAVEEVIVDIPSARLARLKGWRLVVGKVRDALAKLGFERMAAQIDAWLTGHLTERQLADLAVADLVRAARGFYAKRRVARLADDAAAQEQWLNREARARGFKDIDDLAERAYPVFEKLAELWRRQHPASALLSQRPTAERALSFDAASSAVIADFRNDVPLKSRPEYRAAKSGDRAAAADLVQALVKSQNLQAARDAFGLDVVYVPVHAEEATGRNQIPNMLAAYYAAKAGGTVDNDIVQSNRAFHTGASAMERLIARAEFSGKVESGRRYVLVDDVTTMGSTLADLAAFIRVGGGEVAGSVVLVNAMRGGRMLADAKTVRELEVRHGDEIRSQFGVAPGALTAEEARYLIGFRSTDELRGRVAAARQARVDRLGARAIRQVRRADDDLTRLSVAPLPRRRDLVIEPGWAMPEGTRFDSFAYKLQDKLIDLKRAVGAVTKSAGQIEDRWDTYLQEELFHERAAKRTQDFVKLELAPLLDEMKVKGVTQDTLDAYLHARHAKEANQLIAERNPELQDGGSGMTDAEADAYMAGLEPGEKSALEALAAKADAIIAKTRETYVGYGLESQGTVDGWARMFKHYVPLMREDHDDGMGIGQGFSIRGDEAKHRTGSTAKVVDILANIALQREKAIVRGEKNRVAVSLAGLAKTNPNPDVWTFGVVPKEQVFNPKTGLVEERVDPLFKSRPNALVAKIIGKDGKVHERAVIFNERNERAMRLAAALKNLDAATLEGVIGLSAKITRYFAAVNTQYNPVFGAVNLVRDVQGALINLTSTPLAAHRKAILKHTASALKGVYVDSRAARAGKAAASPWAALWEEFQNEGGATGFRDLYRTSADRAKAIERALDPHKWMQNPLGQVFTAGGSLKVPMAVAQDKAGWLFDWLSDYNQSMENAVRLAAYKVALEQGMSKQRAASLAKNLTVNFNRRGQAGMQAGALYAFFNASMQGIARMADVLLDMREGDVRTLRLSKIGKRIVAGGVMLGAMNALMLAAAGFDDEEPPEFVRERNLVIPVGGKKYVAIPMPLGWHVLHNLGRVPTEFMLGGFKEPAKHVIELMGVIADAFNPIGNAGLSMQTLAPTALDPFVALTENRDWTGRPIAAPSFNDATPGFTRAKDTATTPARWIAEAINWMSGGTQYKAGAWSPTPDQIDYLWGQVTGGVGRESAKAEQTVKALWSGEDLPPHKIPLVGRFFGDAAGASGQAGQFYTNLKVMDGHEAQIKGLAKAAAQAGSVAESNELYAERESYMKDNPEAELWPRANVAHRRVQHLRERKRELVKAGAPRAEVKKVEDDITAAMREFNAEVRTAREPKPAPAPTPARPTAPRVPTAPPA